jgi:hypothetical protein
MFTIVTYKGQKKEKEINNYRNHGTKAERTHGLRVQ